MEEYGLWSSADYLYDEKTNQTLANDENATPDQGLHCLHTECSIIV